MNDTKATTHSGSTASSEAFEYTTAGEYKNRKPAGTTAFSQQIKYISVDSGQDRITVVSSSDASKRSLIKALNEKLYQWGKR